MPKDFDLDGAVKANFDGLVGNMRAKRLRGELPKDEPVEPVAGDADADDGDQAALESMLGSYGE